MAGVSYTVSADNSSYDAPASNDTISATGSNDTIRGGEGDDIVDGRGASGFVFLVGGASDPYSHGGSDTIYGGSHGDNISTGPGYQAAQQPDVGSFAGHSLVFGGAGQDEITSNDYTTIYAGQGNDYIVGQGLASIIYGGQGDDYFRFVSGYISGDAGADTIIGGSGTIVGGDGNDYVDASGNSAYNRTDASIIFGNAGNDTLGAGGGPLPSTVYGGKGDDEIGSLYGNNDYLSGDEGNDTIYAGSSETHGDIAIGGNGNDVISAQNASGYGNAGNDTLYAYGSATIYGGQGNDNLSAGVNNGEGRNYLSGDLGNDTLTSGPQGLDTLIGGQGADIIVIGSHDAASGVLVAINAPDSTAKQGAVQGVGDESNLDHLTGFNFSSDRIIIAGHPSGASSGVSTFVDPVAQSSEASAFQAAYLYAFGDGTSAHTAHVPGSGYLAVQESYPDTTAVYLFTADHVAVAFEGATTSTFQAGAIVQG